MKGNLPKAKYDDCIEYKSKARAISAGPRREEVQKVVEKEEYKKIEEPKI